MLAIKPDALGLEPNPRHEHLNPLGAPIPLSGVTVLLSPSLPSSGWWLTRLHHPLHHVLHPNRRLIDVLLLRPSQMPGFPLVSATLIGWYKPLLRPLMLRSMRPRGLEPMSWCLSPWCLMPRSLMLNCRYSAILSLSRHFFLGFGLLCFQEGALRPYMPTETAVMANRRSSEGMRLLSA
jgi:hypothetical protein